MKTIYKGKDDIYYVINLHNENGETVLPSDLDAFTILVFTCDTSTGLSYGVDDVRDDVLYVPATDLLNLKDGALKLRISLGLENENYPDNSYDVTTDRLTGLFLKTIK